MFSGAAGTTASCCKTWPRDSPGPTGSGVHWRSEESPSGSKNESASARIVGLARDALDQKGEDIVVRVAVGPSGARGKIDRRLPQNAHELFRAPAQIVDACLVLRQREGLADPRGVAEEMPHAYLRRQPAELRQVLDDRVVQRQESLFGQPQNQCRQELLADRTELEHRAVRHRFCALVIGQSVPARPDDTFTPENHERQARNPVVVASRRRNRVEFRWRHGG